MDIKDLNSSRLLFNLTSKTLVKDFTAAIPELSLYMGKISHKRLIQYIIIMYDINSSLWRSYPSYFSRKFECAKIVGFKTTPGGKYPKDVGDMLMGLNKIVNDIIVAYISKFALPEYVQLITFNIILDNETRGLLAGEVSKDSDKVIDRVVEKISELTRRIFNSGNEDEIVYIRQALYARAKKDQALYKPEDIATLLSQGGDLGDDFNPYEDGYKPEPIKFAGSNIDIAIRKDEE